MAVREGASRSTGKFFSAKGRGFLDQSRPTGETERELTGCGFECSPAIKLFPPRPAGGISLQESSMFFIPGYIVAVCQDGEGQVLFRSWKQSIRERNNVEERAAKLALAGYFRDQRRGERDQQAATFLESLSGAVEPRFYHGVDPVRERNSYGYLIRRCSVRSTGKR